MYKIIYATRMDKKKNMRRNKNKKTMPGSVIINGLHVFYNVIMPKSDGLKYIFL